MCLARDHDSRKGQHEQHFQRLSHRGVVLPETVGKETLLCSTISRLALCSVPIAPVRSRAPWRISIRLPMGKTQGRGHEASMRKLSSAPYRRLLVLEVRSGRDITAVASSMSKYRTQGTRLERNATDEFHACALVEIGAQLYQTKVSPMRSVLFCTNHRSVCCWHPCMPARPH